MLFQDLGSRQVIARFDGGAVTSDAGGLLLREVEAKFHFVAQFARCFTDHRDPELLEHPVLDLLKQRVFGLCLGYPDLNDHDRLRHDPLLAVLVGKKGPTGQDRARARDKGKALAGKCTLNRLELTPVRAKGSSRYKKVVAHLDAMQAFFARAFVQQHLLPPARLVLDVDATDFVRHGRQLGRFFHGYTTPTATCRCTSSAATIRCWPCCGRPTSTSAPACSSTWPASWGNCAGTGRRCRSWSAATAASAATT